MSLDRLQTLLSFFGELFAHHDASLVLCVLVIRVIFTREMLAHVFLEFGWDMCHARNVLLLPKILPWVVFGSKVGIWMRVEHS